MCHHRADHLYAWKDYLRIEKDYLPREKTIYGLKRLFMGLRLFLQNSEFIFDHMMHFQPINEQEYMNAIHNMISSSIWIKLQW